MNYERLAQIDLQNGINASAPKLSQLSEASLDEQSWNQIISGDGYTRPLRGFTTDGANTGSRKMLVIGDTWGGIKDDGGTDGAGSFFEDIGRSRWGIGAGLPHIEGTNVTGWTLSTNLQVSVKTSGVYGAPVAAGLAQPSAPTVGVVEVAGNVSNSVSAKIERTRPSTGARSLASPTSAVVVPQGNRVRVTFPVAVSGQTHWRVYFTFQGFGGTGIHYLADYSGVTDITEATVAAGTVDGVARSLEFNYQDGDLIPIEASFDDYTPPAATHAVRLGSVMNLVGAFADATAAPTSTAPGVAVAVSKQNAYESYIPTHLLYLPEPVVDVLSRPIDDYAFIACQNSIHAIQFIGDRGEELPPCTITTPLPDIGIEYQHNWCQFRGMLLVYSAQGNLLMMDRSGNFDTSFANPVAKILQTFDPQNTIVGYDAENDSCIVGNGKRVLIYSLQAQQWKQVWLPDFAVDGTVLSCVEVQRTLRISVDDTSTVDSYQWDTGSAVAPIALVSGLQSSPGGNASAKDIFELAVSGESGVTGTYARLAICIARNGHQMAYRQIGVSTASPLATLTGGVFPAGLTGKRVLILKEDLESAGVAAFEGVVDSYFSSNRLTINQLGGGSMNPSGTHDDLLMFIGDFTTIIDFDETMHPPNIFPNVPECRSYQVGMWFKGQDDVGNLLTCDVFGAVYPVGRVL